MTLTSMYSECLNEIQIYARDRKYLWRSHMLCHMHTLTIVHHNSMGVNLW